MRQSAKSFEPKSIFGILTIGLILLIVAFSLGGAGMIVMQYHELRSKDGAATEVVRMRNGVFAILDVVRAHDAVEAALLEGHLNGAAGAQLHEAADLLFARAESFHDRAGKTPSESAQRVITVLNSMVASLDNMMATPDRISTHTERLRDTIKKTSAALVNYYDDHRKLHIRAVARQENLLRQLVQTTLGLILMFMVITIIAIFLWRAEFLGRIHRRRAEERANRLAYFDALTGLPNRTSFMKAASKIMGTSPSPALFLIDLDDFKLVNDTHGHHVGDAMLQLVGTRLSGIFGQNGGIAARLGGDEFAAILPNGGKSQVLENFVQNVIDQLAVPEMHDGVKLLPRISLGAATPEMLEPTEAPSLDALMRAADYALYEAKSAGRFTGRIYDREMAATIAERRELKQEMPTALKQGEFFVEYQPQFNLHTGELHGFEALARWRRNGGVVPPGVFIEIAEEDDFIIALDAWVLREALTQGAVWNAASLAPVQISANLSARNFRSPSLIADISKALGESGLRPEFLTLEITESVLIEDWALTIDTLEELTALGMKIALDDFGTGFSSLSYLRRLKVDEVKIDRAFVMDIETSDRTLMMLDALVDISQGLGMQLTVEGIETPGQATILSDLGGDVGQGFLFSWPVTPEEALEIVQSGTRIQDFGSNSHAHHAIGA